MLRLPKIFGSSIVSFVMRHTKITLWVITQRSERTLTYMRGT